MRAKNRHRFVPVAVFYFPSGDKSMSLESVRPDVNLLSAFTLMIVGAFAAGLPMALAIIWVCS